MKSQHILLMLTLIILPLNASADEADTCDSSCDNGYRLISYADGNSVSCACVAEGEMEPTVPDPNVIEGPIAVDSE